MAAEKALGTLAQKVSKVWDRAVEQQMALQLSAEERKTPGVFELQQQVSRTDAEAWRAAEEKRQKKDGLLLLEKYRDKLNWVTLKVAARQHSEARSIRGDSTLPSKLVLARDCAAQLAELRYKLSAEDVLGCWEALGRVGWLVMMLATNSEEDEKTMNKLKQNASSKRRREGAGAEWREAETTWEVRHSSSGQWVRLERCAKGEKNEVAAATARTLGWSKEKATPGQELILWLQAPGSKEGKGQPSAFKVGAQWCSWW